MWRKRRKLLLLESAKVSSISITFIYHIFISHLVHYQSYFDRLNLRLLFYINLDVTLNGTI